MSRLATSVSPSETLAPVTTERAHEFDESQYLVPPLLKRWPNIFRYCQDHFRKVRLIPKLGWYQLRADVVDTRLGLFWLVISPVLLAIPSIFVFGFLLEVDRGVQNYPLFAFVGLLGFRIFSRTWIRTAATFRPRGRPNVPAGVPATVGVSAHAFQESLASLFGLVVCFGWSLAINSALPQFFPLLLGVTAISYFLATGGGFIVAGVSQRSADLAQAFPHLIGTLGYICGVWFLPTAYVGGTVFEPLFEWNPLAIALEMQRASITGTTIDLVALLVFVGAALGINIVGMLFLWHTERFSTR